MVVPYESTELFNQKLVYLIRKLKFRSLELLRKGIFQIFQSEKKVFKENTCSKHWWFNYLKRNPPIKELWKGLPLPQAANKTVLRIALTEEMDFLTSTSDSIDGSESLTCIESSEINEQKEKSWINYDDWNPDNFITY